MSAEKIYVELIRLFVSGAITVDEFVQSYLELTNILHWFGAFDDFGSQRSDVMGIVHRLYPEVNAYPNDLWTRKETYRVTADKLYETAHHVLNKLNELQAEYNP